MSSGLSTLHKKYRLQHSPTLQFSTKDNYKCVDVDPNLKKSDPKLYDSIIKFAKANKLRICKKDSGGK